MSLQHDTRADAPSATTQNPSPASGSADAGGAPTNDASGTPRAASHGGSILPGLAVAALIVGGIGVFAYADWRAAHPLADVPDDVEPVLKVPGDVPRALRR